jgi:hypothetical protein
MTWTLRFLVTSFIVITTTAYSGWSGDFTGNAPGFSGGGSEKSTSKSTQPKDNEENAEGGLEGEAEGDSENNDDIKVDETEQCISRDPGFVKVLSFETPPKGFVGTTHANMQLANEYESLYGVKFSSSSGHQAILRQTSRQGEAQPIAGDEAWLCVLCAGSPSRNRLLDAAAETTVGRFAVSSTAAAKNEMVRGLSPFFNLSLC